jgi:hypothetical protein
LRLGLCENGSGRAAAGQGHQRQGADAEVSLAKQWHGP